MDCDLQRYLWQPDSDSTRKVNRVRLGQSAAVLPQQAQRAFRHDAHANWQAAFMNIEDGTVMRPIEFIQLRAQA